MLTSFVWAFACALFVTVVIACIPTTILLHRSATHMAIELSRSAILFFKSLLWLTTGIRTKEWVAVHRKHHAFTDVEGDPHSPILLGFWHVQVLNILYYSREIKELWASGEIEKYSQGVEEDWWDLYLFNHGKTGLFIGTSLFFFGAGPYIGYGWTLLTALMHAVLYIELNSSINGYCHHKGYRTFEDNDATNVPSLALFTGGEGLHNNHHAYPSSPKLSYSGSGKWEVDPAWPVIKLLFLLGMAKSRRQTIEEIRV
jgi:stearoyl-CoA desaturase (delta-9 desaturase)